VSRVRSSVTNNNGFWIGWLDLLELLWQLLLISINYNSSNRWLSTTCPIPSWTTSAFSSTVTDLILIYDSVTSSVSVVRCLTLHSWAPNSLTNKSAFTNDRLKNELVDYSSTNESINYVSSFYNSERTEGRPSPRTVRLLLRLFVVTGKCLLNRCLAMDYSASIRCCVNVC
jgi:hypothetical protein